MKVYIAGKITGEPNYKGKFAAEAEKIRAAGHIALNPAWVEWLMGFPIGWTDLNASETR